MSKHSAERQACLTGAWLSGGRLLDRQSTTLTLLGLGLALWQQAELPIHAGLLLATILGCLEKYYAIRVNFDRQVFADWAKRWSELDGSSPEETMAEFDEALMKMGLRHRVVQQQRTLEERIAGSRSMLRRQTICLSLQYASLVGAVLARFALP